MSTRNHLIRKALGSTYLVYDNCRVNHYAVWCSKYAINLGLPLMHMLQNKALYNWYATQWQLLVEEPFFNDHKEYLEAGIVDPENFQDLFLQYAEAIQSNYPKALLDLIKSDLKTHRNSIKHPFN